MSTMTTPAPTPAPTPANGANGSAKRRAADAPTPAEATAPAVTDPEAEARAEAEALTRGFRVGLDTERAIPPFEAGRKAGKKHARKERDGMLVDARVTAWAEAVAAKRVKLGTVPKALQEAVSLELKRQ